MKYKYLLNAFQNQTLITINTFTGFTFHECLIIELTSNEIAFRCYNEMTDNFNEVITDIKIIESLIIPSIKKE